VECRASACHPYHTPIMMQIHTRIRCFPPCLPSHKLVRRHFSAAAGTKRKWSVDRTTGLVSSTSSDDNANVAPTYQTIIGLEIHARLTACPTKLFSPSPNGAAVSPSPPSSSTPAPPNRLIAPFDLAHPGTLPRLSTTAIQHALLSTAALNCAINPVSRFERKHYFWHDLPHGFQITQQRWPIGGEGTLRVEKGVGSGGGGDRQTTKKKKGKQKKGSKGKGRSFKTDASDQTYFDVGIDRIQLEIDTAKTTTSATNPSLSLVNLNRAGAPLIEIVFAPTIRSASQAADAVETLRRVLKYAGTCNGKMEEGNLRVDLNVSVAKVLDGAEDADDYCNDGSSMDAVEAMYRHHLPSNVGPRTEVKNLNSLRQVVASAEYEAIRQVKLAEEYANNQSEPASQRPGKETRTFDPRAQRTVKIRDKGGAVDYRFLPEPDLPPVVLSSTVLDGHDTLQHFLSEHLPESPDSALERLILEYGLEERVARVICAEPEIVHMYEDAVRVAAEELVVDHDTLRQSVNAERDELVKLAHAVSNWLCNDLFGLWKGGKDNEGDDGNVTDTTTVDANRLGSLVAAVHDGTISTPMGKKILSVMYGEESTLAPRKIADARGWKVITDADELKSLCRVVVHDPMNAKQMDQYRQGGRNVQKMSKFFLGKVMGASRGNAHPGLAADALEEVMNDTDISGANDM